MKDAHLPGLVTHVQKQLSKSNDLCSGPHSQEFFVNCPHPVPWGFEVVSKQLLALRKKKIIKSTETEAVGLNPQGASQVLWTVDLRVLCDSPLPGTGLKGSAPSPTWPSWMGLPAVSSTLQPLSSRGGSRLRPLMLSSLRVS